MAIDGIGGGSFPKDILSGIQSISTGITKTAESGISSIQNSLKAFESQTTVPFDVSALQQFSDIASPAYLPPPYDFFGKLATESSSAGKFPASDLANKLKYPADARAALTDLIDSIQEKLNGIGDDAQLANVDLQNTLQKQQQALQMLSTISKMVSDAANSIIRKIGG